MPARSSKGVEPPARSVRRPRKTRTSSWSARWRALLQALHRVHDLPALEALIDALAHPTRTQVLAFVNAHAMNLAARDAQFCHDLLAADTLLRDGAGMACLMRALRQRPGLNLNGTDLIPRLLQRYAGRSIVLVGTREPWLSRACERVLAIAPGARCVALDGFAPLQDYVSLVEKARPALVVLAMGMPRQEAVAQALRPVLTEPALLVCGGAILDFLAGRHARAPRGLQRLGLEWAWRLMHEPRRLFMRYVVGNPLFLARTLSLVVRSNQSAALSRKERA